MTTMRMRVGSIALAAGLTGACHRSGPAADPPEGPETGPKLEASSLILPATANGSSMVSVEAVAGPDRRDSTTLGGRLVWDEDRTVRIFTPIAGRVTNVRIDAGRRVARGETLALLAAPDFGQALADAHRATADWTLACRTLARQRDLLTHGVAAAKDVEAAEADSVRALAEKQRADDRVALYGGESGGATGGFSLRSPLAGLVVERNLSPGQEVRPDQMLANAPQLLAPLFVVTDPKRLWIELDVPEREIPRLHVGADLTVAVLAWPGRTFRGKLTLVGSEIDPTSRTAKARGVVDNASEELKAQMLVSVAVSVPPGTGIEVPSRAIFQEGTEQVVFVEDRPNCYRHVTVVVGAERDGKVPVMSGLHPGDKVVVDGSLLLNQLYHSLRPAGTKSSTT
jgi:cobalt-zinc-cadmium efflux system membrane fusion protein